MKQTLLLTIVFGIDEYRETPYFRSREEWSSRHGIRHLLIDESSTGLRMHQDCAAWTRIPLMLLLEDRYDLMYLDFDCVVHPDCPAFSAITGGGTGLFMAHGRTGRPNSGVMLNIGQNDVIRFCAEHCADEVPALCRVTKKENGHIIWACQEYGFHRLSPLYNNTIDERGFIVHHTGPNLKRRQIKVRSPDGSYDYALDGRWSPDFLFALGHDVLTRTGTI